MAANTRCLQDFRILITWLSNKERIQVQDLAQQQGAIVLSNATLNDPPHVVITRRVGSAKYVAVMRRNARTPVVTPEWLVASIQAGRRLPFDHFAAKGMHGLVVCFSGLKIDEKKRYAQQIESLGGKHSPSLDDGCTHLVTNSTDSDKYRWAKLHNKVCVSVQWIIDSLAQGWCQEEKPYLISDENDPAGPESNPATQNNTSRQPVLQGDAEQSLLREGSLGPRGSQGVSGLSETETLRGGTEGGTELQRTASRLRNEGPPLAAEDLGAPMSNVPQTSNTEQPSLVWNDLEWDDSTPPFLDACYLWAVGCTPQETFELIKCIRQGAAKRFLEPVPELTHIIVGSDLSSLEADALSKAIVDHKSAAVVSLEWLQWSVARRELLPADERFLISSATVKELLNRKALAAIAAPAGQHLGEPSVDGFEPSRLGVSNTIPLSRQGSGMLTPQGCFTNCYFTLAALRSAPEEAKKAETLIRKNGGRIFTASLPTSVASGRDKAFAICPFSLTPAQIAAIRGSNPDFAAVDESARFTVYWLECCIAASSLLEYNRATPCYKPLPYSLPLPGIEHISVAVSGYNANVRAAIENTLKIIGGKYRKDCMSAEDTHLIVDFARGEKYKHTARLGVVPVTADWLVDSIQTGKLQPEQHYRPKPVPGMSQAASLLPARLLQDGDSGPSQIGATQMAPATAGAKLPAGFTSVYAAVTQGLPGGGQQPTGSTRNASSVAGQAAAAQGPPPKHTSLRSRMQHYAQMGGPNAAQTGANMGDVGVAKANENSPGAAARATRQQLQNQPLAAGGGGGGGGLQALLGECPAAPENKGSSAAAPYLYDALFRDGPVPIHTAPAALVGIRNGESPTGFIDGNVTAPPAPSAAVATPREGRRAAGLNGGKAGSGKKGGRGSAMKAPLPLVRSPGTKRQQQQQQQQQRGAAAPTGTQHQQQPGTARKRPQRHPTPRQQEQKQLQEQQDEQCVEAMEVEPPAAGAVQTEEEDGGLELEAALDNIASLMDKVKAKHDAGMIGSQEAFMAPTMLTRKRGQSRAGQEAAAAVKRSRSTAAAAANSLGHQLRRSNRARGPDPFREELRIEASQQVGYDTEPASRLTRSSSVPSGSNVNGDAAKQRLRQMARQRRTDSATGAAAGDF